jgi:hypothetical protein
MKSQLPAIAFGNLSHLSGPLRTGCKDDEILRMLNVLALTTELGEAA